MIQNVLDLSLVEWQEFFQSIDEPVYRAKQLWEGLHKHQFDQPDQFSAIPKGLREKIQLRYAFTSVKPGSELCSQDGSTRKLSFILNDNRVIETVLMRYDMRNTVCVSTQAGCAMGCVFCATGQMGFMRNLSAGEIIEQVYHFVRYLKQEEQRVTNIVFMGMGEPFHNYDAVMKAIEILNDPQGFNLGQRHMTISTVGLIPGIQKFASERRQVNLAISLHAADDQLRTSMVPINKKYPLVELLDACREYVHITGRRVTFEYALIQDVNDSVEHANRLAGLLKGMICHVNVIPLNPTKKYPGKATTRERAQAFQKVLQDAGIPCTIRLRRGIEIQAGCGQLASESAVI